MAYTPLYSIPFGSMISTGIRVIRILFLGMSLCIHILSGPVVGQSLRPHGFVEQDTFHLSHGALKATFVNNKAIGPLHKAGYNGIAELLHTHEDRPVFVPFYAGFNLEHIFGGDSLRELFEPRKYPMELYKANDTTVLLYQKATPLSQVESLTTFTLASPHYIDIRFSCILHDLNFFPHGYAGLFWASYIHQPQDKNIYFEGLDNKNGTPHWIEAFSTQHGTQSTHKSATDDLDSYFAENFNASLASHFSGYRFSSPYYFGKFHDMALGYMFDSDETIRFSQSPDGAGEGNPAWDFQFLIPSPQTGKTYTFKARMVYTPFVDKDGIKGEYIKWLKLGK